VRYRIVTVGKPSLAFAREAVGLYLPRLERFAKVEVVHVRDGGRLLSATAGTLRVVLDEGGQLLDTAGFTAQLGRWADDPGVKAVSFLVGGADGHPDEVRAAADHLLALSPLTLQHELALAVLLEQLYRAHSILGGAPYHRGG
jgi:23S rRNA (pseudouridine1915-N3)-methyltransferase